MNIGMYVGSLAGHPELYARVIGRILTTAGHRVILLTGPSSNSFPWRSDNPFGTELVVAPAPKREVDQRTLAQLAQEHKIERLLFLDCDSYYDEFGSWSCSKLSGFPCLTLGIFSRTAEWFPGEPLYFLPPRERWREAISYLRRMIKGPDRKLVQHRNFFNRFVVPGRAVDVAIVKDERVSHRYNHLAWMPEIYQDPDANSGFFATATEEKVSRQLHELREENLLLYFGNSAFYKGYDLFLGLVSSDKTAIGVHIGAVDEHNIHHFPASVPELRNTLLNENRLIESGGFASEALSRLAFGSIKRFVSFHRLSGTSGTVLQAIAAQLPILTPSAGLIGYRTKMYGAGLTYRPCDQHSLYRQWKRFRHCERDNFADGIDKYANAFTASCVNRFFRSIFE